MKKPVVLAKFAALLIGLSILSACVEVANEVKAGTDSTRGKGHTNDQVVNWVGYLIQSNAPDRKMHVAMTSPNPQISFSNPCRAKWTNGVEIGSKVRFKETIVSGNCNNGYGTIAMPTRNIIQYEFVPHVGGAVNSVAILVPEGTATPSDATLLNMSKDFSAGRIQKSVDRNLSDAEAAAAALAIIGVSAAILGMGVDALIPDGTGASNASSFTATYTLVCRNRVLLQIDDFRRGRSTSCTGDIQQCRAKFERELEARFESLDKACKSSFGSDYTYETIDHQY